VAKQRQQRILRNYRNLPPSKFHRFNQKVKDGLTNHAKVPESAWAGNPTLLPTYLATSEKHDSVYHEAGYGSKLLISQRDILQNELVDHLDEIASVLEAVAVRTPEVLLASGFDLTKDRRGYSKAHVSQPVSE
jgi:hypothetical protein